MTEFDVAIKKGCKIIYILIEAEGVREVILIPKESFKAKKEFYQRAYTDNLTHAMNKDVKIHGFGSLIDLETNIFKDII